MMPEHDRPAFAAGRGQLRASHADRERVIETLKVAFMQGRLAKDEFDLRTSRTFGSRTYADLAALTADLPAGLLNARPVKAQPPPVPVPDEDPTRMSTALGVGACVFVWLGLVAIVMSIPTQLFPLMSFGVLAILAASPLAGELVLQTWRERHRSGQVRSGTVSDTTRAG